MPTQNELTQYSGMQTTWGSLGACLWFMVWQVGLHGLLIVNFTVIFFYTMSVSFTQHHTNLQSLLHMQIFDTTAAYELQETSDSSILLPGMTAIYWPTPLPIN
jgi:hypothetical protein